MYKVVIGAGGTGGHLFPAQALAADLQEKLPGIEIVFMAKGLAGNARFQKGDFAFQDIASATFCKNPLKLLLNCCKLLQGTWQSILFLRKFKPDLVIGFGSYHTFPVVLGARLLSFPYIIHESNSVPGMVNRFLAKKARWTGVFFPEAAKLLTGRSKEVSIPLRKECTSAFQPSKESALNYYGLESGKKTLLVFGGSQGAFGINELLLQIAPLLNEKLQLIHFTGSIESTAQAKLQYERLGIVARVKDFETKMHFAWKTADCFIARSGSVTIAEQIAFAVPGIFIPYPKATENHQEKNARYVRDVLKGGLFFRQEALDPKFFAEQLNDFLKEESLTIMRENLARHSTRLGSCDFGDLIINFLKSESCRP